MCKMLGGRVLGDSTVRQPIFAKFAVRPFLIFLKMGIWGKSGPEISMVLSKKI